MDYHCPICARNLERRRLTEAVITRMEIDCAYCRGTIRLNVHRSELALVVGNFGAIVALATLAYWLGSQSLILAAFGCAMAGALALPVLERTWLRDWPRYKKIVRSPGP